MRTVYLGTSEFAVTVLERLAASPHRPSLVVTRPDRGRGRGRKVHPPPVAEAARALEIDLDQPDSVGDPQAGERIAAHEPVAVLICAFGALIKEPLLSAYPMFNVHPSLLPRWRGAAPVERAIEAGDAETGVTIMRPIEAMDAGPICLQEREPIGPEDDYGSLAPRLAEIGGDLLVRALDERPAFVEQPGEGTTLAPKIAAEDRRLDPGRPALELERLVRALNPHVGAYIDWREERLGVAAARLAGEQAPPGGLRDGGGRLLYGTAAGALELMRVKPPGGREMDAAAFLRGRKL